MFQTTNQFLCFFTFSTPGIQLPWHRVNPSGGGPCHASGVATATWWLLCRFGRCAFVWVRSGVMVPWWRPTLMPWFGLIVVDDMPKISQNHQSCCLNFLCGNSMNLDRLLILWPSDELLINLTLQRNGPSQKEICNKWQYPTCRLVCTVCLHRTVILFSARNATGRAWLPYNNMSSSPVCSIGCKFQPLLIALISCKPWYNTLCIDYVDKCSTFLHDYTECEMFNFVHCRYWIRSEHFWWLDVLFLFIYKFKCHGKITMVRNRNQTVDICSKISPKLTETTSNSARAPKMMHAICSSECRFALKGQAQRIPCSLRIHVLTSVVSNNHEITIFFDHQITIK